MKILGIEIRTSIDKFEKRFLNMCMPEPNTGCWIWMGGTINSGYGHFGVIRSKNKLSHRVSYKLFKSDIPEGLHIDHLCRNRLDYV